MSRFTTVNNISRDLVFSLFPYKIYHPFNEMLSDLVSLEQKWCRYALSMVGPVDKQQ
jgi:hypothetical protein